MPALHIRDVPSDVLDALKRRAQREQRSLQGELRYLLTQIARDEPPVEPRAALRLHMSEAHEGSWSREEMYGDDGR